MPETSTESIFFFEPGKSEARRIESLARGGEEAARLREVLGGKGAGLHLLSVLGFPVPPGFTISATACEEYHRGGGRLTPALRGDLARAVARLESMCGRSLGAGPAFLRVAVRSGAAESMPGMMDTVLGVDSLEGIERAVEKVFRSWRSERATVYRRERGIAGLRGTAVTVQAMCEAESAGVAFTADPANGAAAVIVEAVAGLGEALVSGETTPDRFRLGRPELEPIESAVAGRAPAISTDEARRIARQAIELEELFGKPVDIEWGIEHGEVRLLQVRALKVADSSGPARLLRREAARLHRALRRTETDDGDAAGGLFVRHNLDETLHHPTPLTWDIYRALLRGRGGLPGLYLDLGFRPSPRVVEEGFVELVAGRLYADLDRAGELFYGTRILRHDELAVREDPDLVSGPPDRWDPSSATPLAILQTLAVTFRSERRIRRALEEAPDRFQKRVLPDYLAWHRNKTAVDLALLDGSRLLDELDDRVGQVFDRFPREALQLSFLAGVAFADLRDMLERRLGEPEGERSARTLVSVLDDDTSVAKNRELARVSDGEVPLSDFLERWGHRAAGEMELSQPRWHEEPDRVLALAGTFEGGLLQRIEKRRRERKRDAAREESRVEAAFAQAGGPRATAEFRRALDRARRLLPWREDWKHHWMRGVDLVRQVILEIDRRLALEGLGFYLTRRELREALEHGLSREHRRRIRERREDERTARSLSLPEALTVRELAELADEARGNASRVAGAMVGSGSGGDRDDGRGHGDRDGERAPSGKDVEGREGELRGTALAPGRGRGRVWLCASPGETPPFPPPRVLVCDSTDPGWTPLLAGAQALVVERGGALSHGAIICREFGVPAIVLPGVRRLLRSGERIEVDGETGAVSRLLEEDRVADERPRPDPPDPGTRWTIPAEPWAPAPRPGLGGRTAAGLLAAIAVSVLIVTAPPLRRAVVSALALAYDWTLSAGMSPFASILFAAATSAGAATALAVTAADRERLRRLRERLRWYRSMLRETRRRMGSRAAAADRIDPAARRTVSKIERRRRQTAAERSLELIRPIGWSFLPFCAAFLWVADRFACEPVRPGTTTTVRACFRPAPGNRFLRYARLDIEAGGALRLLDEEYRRLEPNREAPEIGPYAVAWTVEALEPGTVKLTVTARDERLETSFPVTDHRLEAAASGGSGVGAVSGDGEIVALHVEHPPALVELPGPAYRLLDAFAAWITGGRGITPEQAALGPAATFLIWAVLVALVLQRLAGLR